MLPRVLPAPVESAWIDGIYARKEAAARSVKGPKIVLIGGSATHFSFSARMIQDATGLNVINLGTHAGLGVDYILYRARRSLSSGDIAILSLEHHLLFSNEASQVLARYVGCFDPGYILHARRNALRLLFGISPTDMLQGQLSRLIPWSSPLFRPETVTDVGDETANTVASVSPYMRELVRGSPPIAIHSTELSQSIREFAVWAGRNDVRVLFSWPPTVARDVYNTGAYRQYFSAVLAKYAELGIAGLGDPDEFFLPAEEMLDTNYHANVAGQARASSALAMFLCSTVSCRGSIPAGPQRRHSNHRHM
jgi:hypothetical protein